ncbi:MAG: peptidase [Acidimicrobiaceae bacterium]|mgnify:FL=1|nr:peptidase [Acidimicrobiaceae bacterium]
MTDQNPHRLPRQVLPKHYIISLEPDLEGSSFEGTVSIDLDVVSETDTVIVNAAELEIESVYLEQNETIQANSIVLNEELERAEFAFPVVLQPGPARLTCSFKGTLNDKLRGFYRSTWKDESGHERVIATTQFESTNARRAFPCFDEPDLKASFGVTLRVDSSLMAVSCGELISSTELDDGRREDTFADTMVMSTYLVAFIVGELEATEAVNVDGVPLRIVHVPGKGALTEFGLAAAEFSLRWLVDYYDIPYPAGKLDLIAVPDFAFGAMENLGCITFRETLLLSDPERTTQAELTRIVDVIAHEIAHMWFGNLVTMDWWNGIWLKEAFATFMQVAATDAFRPEWRRWDGFCVERGAAFDTDSLASTRPIEFEVVSPQDAEAMYDVLTYEKGAAVVRMLEQFLGIEQFRSGVNHYLTANSYGNTTTTDLWDSLETATGIPVRAAMDTWIFQGGHPVISVETCSEGIKVRQSRFGYGEVGDATWHVPIIVRAQVGSETVQSRLLLEDSEATIDLGGTPAWVIVNAGGHGFYRVSYSKVLRDALSGRALDVLSEAERYGLVDDTWSAVLAGELKAEDHIALITSLASETDLAVWQRMLSSLEHLYAIADPSGQQRLEVLVRDLSTTGLGVLGLEPMDNEPALDRELRAALFAAAGTTGQDASVREMAIALFADASAGNTVEPNLAAAVVRVVAAAGDDATHATLVDLYREAPTPQLEVRYLMALLEIEDIQLFQQTLELITSEVRSQNAPYLLSAAMSHRSHGRLAWELIRDRWEELNEKFPQNSIPRMVSGIRSLSTPDLAAEIQTFFEGHPIPQGHLTVLQHLEKLGVNVELRRREGHRLGA